MTKVAAKLLSKKENQNKFSSNYPNKKTAGADPGTTFSQFIFRFPQFNLFHSHI
jgi:hypothetical protein